MTVKGKYGGRKVRDGTVVSDKMQKTLLVAVEEHLRHPLYKKRVRRLRRFMAHDEREEGKMGDRVRIVEAAPISRKKRWKLVEILQRAELPDVAPESIDLDLLGEVKREEERADETAAAPVAATEPAAAEDAVQDEPSQADEPSEPEAVAEEVTVEDSTDEAAGDETIEPTIEDTTDETNAEAPEAATPEASADEPEAVDAPPEEAETAEASADETDGEGTKE